MIGNITSAPTSISNSALSADAASAGVIANGTMNAVAVFEWEPDERGDTQLRGLAGMVVLSGYPSALYDDALPDVTRFRLDDHQCRFLLQRGPAEDVTTLGWQLDDHATFDEVLTRVTGHGVPVTDGTAASGTLAPRSRSSRAVRAHSRAVRRASSGSASLTTTPSTTTSPRCRHR